jgi:hypothetical protein
MNNPFIEISISGSFLFIILIISLFLISCDCSTPQNDPITYGKIISFQEIKLGGKMNNTINMALLETKKGLIEASVHKNINNPHIGEKWIVNRGEQLSTDNFTTGKTGYVLYMLIKD